MPKYLQDSKQTPTFAPSQGKTSKRAQNKPDDKQKKLPCGVMVARRILVPPVRVRILPRQQFKIATD